MSAQLSVAGQCVFVFDSSSSTSCSFEFKDDSGATLLSVTWTKSAVEVAACDSCPDTSNTKGLTDISGAYYWFSLDAQNMMLHAGIGEPRLETNIYSYKFAYSSYKRYLEKIRVVTYSDEIRMRMLLKDPIPRKLPLTIKNMHELTMHHIATASYMPVANLAEVSQKMYKCIAGKQFVLDDASFPEFSRAIQKSIITPGGWCYETLLKKANEFGKPNPKETYLRITLGMNGGESPGIPYVMEIWPAGHYSPVHSHASADAVIRVLHGSIHVSLYPFLSDSVEPFGKADFAKDDITWISPLLNQTHQLKNITKDVCVTIQCYMYEGKDKKHYDYFDYLDAEGVQQQYEPDSDMGFLEFKEKIRKEWLDYRAERCSTWYSALKGCYK